MVIWFSLDSKLIGTAIGKTGVQSGAVIKGFDVIEDGGASVGQGW